MSGLKLPPCSLQLQVYIVNTARTQQGDMSHDRGDPWAEYYYKYFTQLAPKIQSQQIPELLSNSHK